MSRPNLLNPAVSSPILRRMPAAAGEATLAGRGDDPSPEPGWPPYLAPDRAVDAAPHFVPECFFVTQRLIHAGLIPAGVFWRPWVFLLSSQGDRSSTANHHWACLACEDHASVALHASAWAWGVLHQNTA